MLCTRGFESHPRRRFFFFSNLQPNILWKMAKYPACLRLSNFSKFKNDRSNTCSQIIINNHFCNVYIKGNITDFQNGGCKYQMFVKDLFYLSFQQFNMQLRWKNEQCIAFYQGVFNPGVHRGWDYIHIFRYIIHLNEEADLKKQLHMIIYEC